MDAECIKARAEELVEQSFSMYNRVAALQDETATSEQERDWLAGYMIANAARSLQTSLEFVISAMAACNYQGCRYSPGDTDLINNLSLGEFVALFEDQAIRRSLR